jgi:hypothetical protein
MTNLIQGDPIVLGGYYQGAADATTVALLNYQLAIDEFNLLGGLPGGEGGKLRPVLMVACAANPSPSEASIQHLLTTLEVPGMLAFLSPADLNHVFNLADGRVLFFHPGSCTSRANTNQDHLLWHLLGSPEDLAPPMAALLERTETYLRAQRAGTSDASQPLYVTLVESDYPTLYLTAQTLWPLLKFNGLDAAQNFTGGYLRSVSTQSLLANAVGNASEALDELEAHPPDVILALTTDEFVQQVIPQLEIDWNTVAPDRPRPFYLLSHMLFGSTNLQRDTQWQLENRTVGINFAHYWDRRLYDAYVWRFAQAYPTLGTTSPYTETENDYDAAYYLLYSVVAASAEPGFTGARLAEGFLRIIDPQAMAVDIGPGPLQNEIGPLRGSADYRIQLIGTMGPPNFDLASGTRAPPVSAWCLRPITGGRLFDYVPDVLGYNVTTQEFDGVFPCVPGY